MTDRRALAARLGWSTFDQALSSGTNFLLTVLVARALAPSEFGAFGTAYATYIIILGLGRALAAEPLLVRLSAARPAEQRAGFAAASGVSVVAGVAFGLGCVAVATMIRGTLGASLAVLGVAMPGLLLQDAWRYCFFCRSQPRKAVANDAVWAVAQVVLVAAVLRGGATPPTLIAAWGASAAIAALVGAVQARTVPDLRAARSWVAAHRDVVPGFAVDFLAKQGGPQLALYVVGAAAGLAALGALRAAQALYGPLRVFYVSMTVVAVPEVVRLRDDPARLRRSVARTSLGLAVVGALASVALLLIPGAVGRELLGETWRLARPLLPYVGITLVALGASVGPMVALRGHEDVRRTAHARIGGLALTLIGAAVGSALAGAPGAAVGLAVTAVAGALIWWALWIAASRRLVVEPTSPRGHAVLGHRSPADRL